MKRNLLIITAIVGSLVTIVFGMNHFRLQDPMSEVLESDHRNKGIKVSVHYGKYINPSEIVFNLRAVSGSNSPADVTRVLLQYAETLKENKYERIVLAYQGTPKFQLKGAYFQTLGNEYGSQNPVYTMRTFPENVYNLDGTAAFGTWTGGLLGVVGKEMEDLNEFHKQWYLAEMAHGS